MNKDESRVLYVFYQTNLIMMTYKFRSTGHNSFPNPDKLYICLQSRKSVALGKTKSQLSHFVIINGLSPAYL